MEFDMFMFGPLTIFLYVFAVILGKGKALSKIYMPIMAVISVCYYFYFLNGLANEGSEFTSITNDTYEIKTNGPDLASIPQKYIYVTGNLNSGPLSAPEYGISTTGQYLVKEISIQDDRTYSCGEDNEDTCYEWYWRTLSKSHTFLNSYYLEKTPLSKTVIKALDDYGLLSRVTATDSPKTYNYQGATLYPQFFNDSVIFHQDPTEKQLGDIRIDHYKYSKNALSILGERVNGEIVPVFIADKPLLVTQIQSFKAFKNVYVTLSTELSEAANILFLIFSYIILTVIYKVFNLSDGLLNTNKNKAIYFLSPPLIVIIFNLVIYGFSNLYFI